MIEKKGLQGAFANRMSQQALTDLQSVHPIMDAQEPLLMTVRTTFSQGPGFGPKIIFHMEECSSTSGTAVPMAAYCLLREEYNAVQIYSKNIY